MKQFIVLRSSLIPYSYSNARTAYDEGTFFCQHAFWSRCHGMVLSQGLVCCGQCIMNFLKVQKHTPTINRLLDCCWCVCLCVSVCVRTHVRVRVHVCVPTSTTCIYIMMLQYFYGPDLLVAPITTPMDTDTNLTNKSVWIPKARTILLFSLFLPPSLFHCYHIHLQTVRGSYISWFSGEMFAGDQVLSRNYTLYEMPVFVKSGSIIPMRTDDFSKYIEHGIYVIFWLYIILLFVFRATRISRGDSKKSQTSCFCWRCSSVSINITCIFFFFTINWMCIVERRSCMKMMVTQPSIGTMSMPRLFSLLDTCLWRETIESPMFKCVMGEGISPPPSFWREFVCL